jgi:hypothetical protein
MTTIITRVFPSAAAAKSAAERLLAKGVPERQLDVIGAGADARADLEAAEVHSSAIEPYLKRIKAGNAVLVARTTYKPLQAASMTREVLSKRDTIPVANVTDDFFVPDKVDGSPSVLKDHPLFLTDRRSTRGGGPLSQGFGIGMLKHRSGKRPLMDHGKRMSRMFWPMKLVSQKERSSSVMRGGRYMSKMFWPMRLVSRRG